MTQPTESTRLLERTNNQSQYVFDSSLMRERKRRLRQFQCCACIIFLSILVAGLVITVAYTLNGDDNNLPADDNSTTITSTFDTISNNNQTIIPIDTVLLILNRNLPLSDVQQRINKTINQTAWEEAIYAGQYGLADKDEVEKNIPSLQLRSPSYRHQKVVATSERGRNLSRIGFVEEYATRHLFRNHKNKTLVDKICYDHETGEYCKLKKIECNIFQKYRSFNGSCNNLIHPDKYGVAYRPFRRVLPPDYSDGISGPRRAQNGKALPSARTVSLTVHRPYYRDDPQFTVMLAVWGQFLDHDITATALSQKSNGSTISCCDNKDSITSPECFPVILDSEDPFREYNVSCMEFVRSAPAPTCCLGPREQLNQATPFIDASVVYSSDEDTAKSLRDMQNGTMKVFMTPDGRSLLPKSEDPSDGCNREEEERKGKYCFTTGDARSNENLHLTSMHLIWVRQHNRVAKELQKLNSHWDDERIFQETRRIIAAQMQHITYNEFLPILFGNKLMKKFDLHPRRRGYFDKYNSSLDPTIANNFAAASFRFAHSIIPGLMKLLAKQNANPEYVQMHKMLFNPFDLYKPGELDKTLRGAMNTTIEASDSYFTEELKSHMFEKSNEQTKKPQLCGLDLVSLNVQRGRDHGLPGYTKWRQHCGMKVPQSFKDLQNDMDANSLYNMRTIYRNVDDIDLYTGALSEKPVNGSILGPTITCLLLDQFYRIKYGDRFWYENFKEPQAFTNEQLDEIRKSSLANIICDNSDNLDTIQPKVMERISEKNNYVPCSEIRRPNMLNWKENTLHRIDMSMQNIKIYSAPDPNENN